MRRWYPVRCSTKIDGTSKLDSSAYSRGEMLSAIVPETA